MIEPNSTPQILQARRKSIVINANISRVITRPYMPPTEQRICNIINRVLNLDEVQVNRLFETIVNDFSHRHRYFRETLLRNFERVAKHVPDNKDLSEQRRLLIGSYFTSEYSVEAASLFNPSIVQVPNNESDPEGSCRFIMSFRAIGEDHISSIEFRSGIIDTNNDIYFDALSDYVEAPEIHPNPSYDRHLFRLKLQEMGASNAATHQLVNKLPDNFTFNDLQGKITELQNNGRYLSQERSDAIDMAMWLAQSNYQILFRKDHSNSERVVFPVSESERKEIEDARFVRFVDDDGTVTYYATYTAYNGETILPQLIQTCDFLSFKVITLNGTQAQGKGMALFPRSLSDLGDRCKGEPYLVRFFDHLRRIVNLFNENDRRIWQKWLFRSRFPLSPTDS